MKKNKASLFLTLALLTILLMKNDFFKNIYFVITKNYETRFISAYNKNKFSGYCSKESHGYVYYIKNKFDVNEPPKIINFSENRMKLPYWIFNKNKQDQPALINPGNKVKFYEISKKEYDKF